MQKEPIAFLLTAPFLVVGLGRVQCLRSEATGGSGSGPGSQVLALSYWLPGCFVMASLDRSQVMMALAWVDGNLHEKLIVHGRAWALLDHPAHLQTPLEAALRGQTCLSPGCIFIILCAVSLTA